MNHQEKCKMTLDYLHALGTYEEVGAQFNVDGQRAHQIVRAMLGAAGCTYRSIAMSRDRLAVEFGLWVQRYRGRYTPNSPETFHMELERDEEERWRFLK